MACDRQLRLNRPADLVASCSLSISRPLRVTALQQRRRDALDQRPLAIDNLIDRAQQKNPVVSSAKRFASAIKVVRAARTGVESAPSL